MLRFYDRARSLALTRLEEAEIWPLLTYGVINPYGPTVMGLALLAGEGEDAAELVYHSLNPFAQDVMAIAEYLGDDREADLDWHLVEAINRFRLAGERGPTLVLPSRYLSDAETRLVLRQLLSQATDLVPMLGRLRRHAHDPWNRVREEVADAMADTTRIMQGEAPDTALAPFATPRQVDDYLDIVLRSEHIEEELRALLAAWRDTLAWQDGSGRARQRPFALPVARLGAILRRMIF